VLLDQNLYTDLAARYSALVSETCQQLLGPEYVLLREEFAVYRKNMPVRDGSIRNILVFFGGIDLTNMTGVVVDALAGLDIGSLAVNIVIGSANPHREQLQIQCQQTDNMKLHIQVSNMAELMAAADLCVGAGGTATWERCSLGLPALAWPVADNQKQLLEHAASVGLVYAPACTRPSVEDVRVHLTALLQNPALCRHISERGMQAVDARGVRRVISRLMAMDIELRPAEIGDMQKVYDWRNHIQVRKYSGDSKEIDFNTHQRWFLNVLEDPDRLLFIGSAGGQDCGVLRYDISGNQAVVSVFVAPDKPGNGYGRALLKSGEKYLMDNRTEVSLILAEVLSDNVISRRLFESCGYVLNTLHYRKRLD
jgi:RimJ/RimL family protein N-acetyltransferase